MNFEDPEKSKHKVNFDDLTPLFPNQRFRMKIDDRAQARANGPSAPAIVTFRSFRLLAQILAGSAPAAGIAFASGIWHSSAVAGALIVCDVVHGMRV